MIQKRAKKGEYGETPLELLLKDRNTNPKADINLLGLNRKIL